MDVEKNLLRFACYSSELFSGMASTMIERICVLGTLGLKVQRVGSRKKKIG
jgi:hypothetical protein